MRLHVDVIGSEQRFGAIDRERFGDVDELAAVIALSRVAFRGTLFVSTVPTASSVARLTKFSDAISSRPDC